MQIDKQTARIFASATMIASLLGNMAAAGAATAPPSMDLSSTTASVVVDSKALHNAQSASIKVGGSQMVVTSGTMLTPAEMVALQQVMTTGQQNIHLSNLGAAVGGKMNLTPFGSTFSDLVIPSQVKTYDAATHPLNIENSLTTAGSLIGYWGGNTFSVTAGDVTVLPGGSITTLGSAHPLNLSLFSLGNLVNFGEISSSGKLTVGAKGDITNAAGAVMSGALGTNVFTGSGNLTNAGTISAATGNLQLTTLPTVDFTINNAGGLLSALNGSLLIGQRGGHAKQTTSVDGGTLSAKDIDIFAGDGHIFVDVDAINGVINATGGDAHIASASSINLGKLDLSGDPDIISGGDLVIQSNQIMHGQNLVIIAQGNISAGPSVNLIDLSSTSGNGGELNIVAGVNFNHANTTDTVTAFSTSGGSVALGNVAIKTGTTVSGKAGGAVRVEANTGNTNTGDITLNSIDTSAKGGTGGGVEIYGDARTFTQSINTTGLKGGGVVAVTTGKVGLFGNPTYNDGLLDVANSHFTSDLNNIATNSSITVNQSVTTSSTGGHGGLIVMDTDQELTIHGNISSNGATGGTVLLGAASGPTSIDGSVNASSPKGNAGKLDILSFGRIRIGSSVTTTGFKGAPVNIASTNGAITIVGGVNSGGVNNGGNITIISKTGTEVGLDIISASTGAGSTAGKVVVASSSTGDVRVGYAVVDNNAPGTTPLLTTPTGGINSSSKLGTGGQVALSTGTSGRVIVGKGINSAGSTTGGLVGVIAADPIKVNGPIITSAPNGTGGKVSLASNGATVDNEFVGVESGPITTSGHTAGDVTLDAELGATTIYGPVLAVGTVGHGGTINMYSLYDTKINGAVNSSGVGPASGGTITVFAGSNMGGTQFGAGTFTVTTGGVNSSSLTKAGGDVKIQGVLGVNIVGGVKTSGLTTAGNFDGDSFNGLYSIVGNVVTTGLASKTGDGGTGGHVVLNTTFGGNGSGVTITGLIQSFGGASVVGNGGAGGTVAISSVLVGGQPTEPISVMAIDTHGGSTTATNKNGGTGGTVAIFGGTVQLTKAVSSASIRATGGFNGTHAQANGGNIAIVTCGIQPFPTHFDTASTANTEYALPGGMFEMGNATVNGAAGPLVTNTTSGPAVIGVGQRVVASTITAGPNKVVIATSLASDSVSEGAVSKPVFVTNGFGPTAPRMMINASEAVYLYDSERNGPGVLVQANGLLAPIAFNIAVVQNPADLHAFKTFHLWGGPGSLVSPGFGVNVNDITPAALIDFSKSTAPVIEGAVVLGSFGGISEHEAVIKTGALPLTISSFGGIHSVGNIRLAIKNDNVLTINNGGAVDLFDALSITAPKGINLQLQNGSNLAGQTTVLVAGTGSKITGAINVTGGHTANFGDLISLYALSLNWGNAAGDPGASSFSNIELYGSANVLSSNTFSILDHAYLLGSLNVKSVDAVSAKAGAFIDVQGSINAQSSWKVFLKGTWVAGQSITLIGTSGVDDLGNTASVTSESGAVTIGAFVNGVQLNGGGSIKSGTDTTIFANGNIPMNCSYDVTATGTARLGSAPAFSAIYTGSMDITGRILSRANTIVEAGGNALIHVDTGGSLLSNGNVQVLLHGGADAQIDTALAAGKNVSVTSEFGTITTGLNSRIFAAENATLTTGGSINLGPDSSVSAGLTVFGFTPPVAPILRSQLRSLGTVDIEAGGNIVCAAPVNPLKQTTLQAFGGNVVLISKGGTVTLAKRQIIDAWGGNVVVLGLNGVTGGATSAGGPFGNTITATCLINGKLATGGGVEIQAGTTTSLLLTGFVPPNPFINSVNNTNAPKVNLSGLTLTNKGEILVGSTAGVTLNTNKDATNGITALGSNPVILIQGSNGSMVTLDSVSITSVTPVASRSVKPTTEQDECVVDASDDETEGADALASAP